MIDHQETPALWDCETLTPVQTNATILNQFWDGFERLDGSLIFFTWFLDSIIFFSSSVTRWWKQWTTSNSQTQRLANEKRFRFDFPDASSRFDEKYSIQFVFSLVGNNRFRMKSSFISSGDYTRRSYHYENTFHQAGSLNIVERLPNYLVKPDLGPKLYIAYSE